MGLFTGKLHLKMGFCLLLLWLMSAPGRQLETTL